MKQLLLILLFLSVSVYAETVYKTVDENGNIIFTDRPSEGAETIEVKEAQSFDLPDVPDYEGSPSSEKPGNDNDAPYSRLAITSPENDEAIHHNEGTISIKAAVEPGLKPSHLLALYMDGKQVLSGKATNFSMTYIDRGTHTLSVAVITADGKTIGQSDTIKFHMRRTSKLTDNSNTDKNTPLNPPKPDKPDVSPTNPPTFDPTPPAPAPPPRP